MSNLASHIQRTFMPTFCQWWKDEQHLLRAMENSRFRKVLEDKQRAMHEAMNSDLEFDMFAPHQVHPEDSIFKGGWIWPEKP